MSNVGYDLDTSGGLMPLIKALIKPPDEDQNGQKPKKPQHPYYKRPGKGHNHDSCDACGEGGDLICCDRCPASFHLGCYDPPLDENDIPAGQWLCKECSGTDLEKPSSSRSSRAQSPSDKSDTSEKKTRNLRNNRTNSTQKKKAKDDETDKESKQLEKKDEELTPMEVLVKAAKIMNPKQFELPREMRVPCPFPGTDRDPAKGSGVITVDAWGCVPIPAKTCFICTETCKMAPLLQCDYCSLLFHLDCLDPPLTALPTGRWMCPNHVEQYIDWKMVNSISATERVALWDQFSGPIDQHAIKIDFLRQARNRWPRFRQKVPVGVSGRVCVPSLVTRHYRRPPPLLPSRREYVRCRRVLQSLKTGDAEEESDEEPQKKHLICLNLNCPQYVQENGVCPHQAEQDALTKLKGATKEESKNDLEALEDKSIKSEVSSEDEEDDETDLEELMMPVKRRKVEDTKKTSTKKKDVKYTKLELQVEDAETAELLCVAEEQLKRLDERLVKLLAWQRLQEILVSTRTHGPWRRAPLSRLGERLLLASLDRARLARDGYTRPALPSQMLSREDEERIAWRVWGAPPRPRPRPAVRERRGTGDLVRAALCEMRTHRSDGAYSVGRADVMRGARLTVGRGACDVTPAVCRRLADLHAIIYYDRVSRHYELLNYSEWGTGVDGVLYTSRVGGDREGGAEEREGGVSGFGGGRGVSDARSITYPDDTHTCACPRQSSDVMSDAAWEGSAILSHGALLTFGCRRYVFCITDHEDDD